MPTLATRVEAFARQQSARRRLALIPSRPCPVELADRGTIASSVPCVRVDVEPSASRKMTLRFEGNGGGAWLKAPLAAPPRKLRDAARRVATARDAQGRTHVVAWLEWDAPRIHVLVDVAAMECVDEAVGETASETGGDTAVDSAVDPAAVVAAVLFAPLLDEALEHVGPPRIGAEVPARLSTLLRAGASGRREAARRDLAMLQRFVDGNPLPERIVHHLRDLQAVADDESIDAVPDPAHVAREVERLTRLVEDRAVSALCVTDDSIVGLVSPRPLAARTWVRPLLFRLSPAQTWGASLRLWDAARTDKPGFAPCLGEAGSVLSRNAREHDAYGLVDTVLNYVETNRIGHTRAASRASLVADARARMLDLPF